MHIIHSNGIHVDEHVGINYQIGSIAGTIYGDRAFIDNWEFTKGG
jgi:hypothetical protein